MAVKQSLDWITLNSEREIYKEQDHRIVLTTLIIIKITVIITIKIWMGEEAEHNTNTNNTILIITYKIIAYLFKIKGKFHIPPITILLFWDVY